MSESGSVTRASLSDTVYWKMWIGMQNHESNKVEWNTFSQLEFNSCKNAWFHDLF